MHIPSHEQPFKLKVELNSMLMMQLCTDNLTHLETKLMDIAQSAPKMLSDANVIFDLTHYSAQDLDWDALKTLLDRVSAVPIAVKNCPSHLLPKIIEKDITLIRKTDSKHEKSPRKKSVQIIKKPIRSGQRIYAKDADLIILGFVSGGAEVIADGNIHIHGALRGRAIAGAAGNTQAQISCQTFQAELVSIAGVYNTYEQKSVEKPVYIHLSDNHILVNEAD